MTTQPVSSIIDRIMSMTALGALAGMFLLGSISLYSAGFYIYNLGYWGGAVGAWVCAFLLTCTGGKVLAVFRGEYRKQKQREADEDYTKETISIIKPGDGDDG